MDDFAAVTPLSVDDSAWALETPGPLSVTAATAVAASTPVNFLCMFPPLGRVDPVSTEFNITRTVSKCNRTRVSNSLRRPRHAVPSGRCGGGGQTAQGDSTTGSGAGTPSDGMPS